MEKGELVEFAKPSELLKNKTGLFYKMMNNE